MIWLVIVLWFITLMLYWRETRTNTKLRAAVGLAILAVSFAKQELDAKSDETSD